MNAKQLAAVIAALTEETPQANGAAPRAMGQNIIVLDRGFVYVGDVTIDGDFLRVTRCRNIRYWGTKEGLGELINGPLAETKLDEVGEIVAPMHALIHLVPCKGF